MSYSRPVFSDIRQRVNYLIGDTTNTTSATIDSSINQSIYDILNSYPFSWDVANTTGSLSSGTFTLALDYNPKWRLKDARIVNSSTNDDNIFTEIDPTERDRFDATTYVYWITYNSTTNRYIFNSTVQTGTVTYYYQYLPAPLSAASDTTLITDLECISLLAAAKNWINDERNQALSHDYEDKANRRIQDMYAQDLNFGPTFNQEGVTSLNPGLKQQGYFGPSTLPWWS